MEYKTLTDYLPSKETVKKTVATGLVALALLGATTVISGCGGTGYNTTPTEEVDGPGGPGGPGGSI